MPGSRTSSRIKTVLVVCGAYWARALLRSQLRKAGYSALGANSLRIAVRYIEDEFPEPVDLLLVDWPPLEIALAHQETAVELMEELRAKHSEAKTVALYDPAMQAPPGEWDELVQRPAPIEMVVEKVQRVLEGSVCRDGGSGFSA